MLVLSRKVGEVITIGSSVTVTVLSVDRGIVRLGINAPKSIPVHRKEIHDKIVETNRQAVKTEISALKKAISKSRILLNNDKSSNVQGKLLNFPEKITDNQQE
ncbi:MAG TPA: carbon storage regulator CsrA [Candidatus Kapabacteria bacterium]|nr:carbon storage regulator CsrA [Candidatus Kapabacteria bacterium]